MPAPQKLQRGARWHAALQRLQARLPRRGRAHGAAPGPRRAAYVLIAGWTYVAALSLAALLLWGYGDRALAGTVLLFGPRWLLLLPLLVLLPASLLLQRRALIPAGLAAILALGPIMGLRIGRLVPVPAPSEAPLRVASFNAAGAVSPVMALLDLLEDEHIDLAAIQECSSDVPRMLMLPPGWHLHAERGLCLLSRHPVEQAEAARWDELQVGLRSGIGGSGTAARYRLHTDGGVMDVVNLHLETPRKGLEQLRYAGEASPVGANTAMRRLGSRKVFEWLGSDRAGLIVLGDFNTPVESTIYRETWGAAFSNAFSRVGLGFGFTKDNGWIRVRIDHVLLGDEWRALRAWVGPDLGSDHWPIMAEIARRGGSAADRAE